MLGKRFFLIAGGTIGGLGAVLSITPPQFGATSGLTLGTGTPLSGSTTATPSASPTPSSISNPPTPTPVATPKPTKKPTNKPTKKPTPRGTKTPPPPVIKPTPVPTPQSGGVNGTFAGDIGNTIYGPVQVQIVVVNNKITNVTALAYPTGSFRTQQISQQAIPYLIQETLAAQSASIQGVGGASYTSQGWINSLQSALTKAKL